MNGIKISKVIFGLVASLYLLASPVIADGNKKVETRTICTQTSKYGSDVETTCYEEEIPVEEVVQEVIEKVDTGIVENLLVVGGLFVAGYALMLLASEKSGVRFN